MAEKISKQEAVRRALAHFGNDAKPSQMQGWIKEQFKIAMSTDHISTAKGSILKAARQKASTGAKAPAPKTAAAPAAAKSQPSVSGRKESGIPLDDILYVKELVGRIGPQQLHTLIDAFAR
jgi:hypothetical protein